MAKAGTKAAAGTGKAKAGTKAAAGTGKAMKTKKNLAELEKNKSGANKIHLASNKA